MDILTQLRSRTADTDYVAKVYFWLTAALMLTGVASYLTVTSGAPVPVPYKGGTLSLAPAVAFGLEHPVISVLVYFGAAFAAMGFRKVPMLGGTLFALFALVTGAFIGPCIALAQIAASASNTFSASPVRDAFMLTVAGAGGMTLYALYSKRVFSTWGSVLVGGLLVLIAAMFIGLFLSSTLFTLLTCSACVILFLLFIAYDTDQVLRKANGDEPLLDAMNLYLDFVNIFLSLLRIFSSTKD